MGRVSSETDFTKWNHQWKREADEFVSQVVRNFAPGGRMFNSKKGSAL